MGLLTGKFHDNPDLFLKVPFLRRIILRNKFQKSRSVIEILKAISVKHDVSPAQVALNWLINFNGNLVVTIPGATKASHVEQNVGAMSFELSDQEIAQIDELSCQFR
jgi:aryl-alcohol dehydrogenase-like predicted oxidoreductase